VAEIARKDRRAADLEHPHLAGASAAAVSRSTARTSTPASGLPIEPGFGAFGGLTDTTGEHSVMP